jgi:2-polyprenyl-3-methyl-5-hydroxy-6-metoxy-1,4-benzoquinol methylase
MMDAEYLRDIYNKRFQQKTSAWTTSDRKKTYSTTIRILSWLRKAGLTEKNPTLLDVGCADGNYTESFRLLGCTCTGLDYSEVIIEQAKQKYPQCSFIHMNGFEPVLETVYDIIFCRGFSGFNTHDLDFIASWANKYIKSLKPGGFLVLGSMSDFSGIETKLEIVNHTHAEIKQFVPLLQARFIGIYYFYFFGWLSMIKKKIQQTLSGKKIKQEYYLIFRNL